jgi:ADP-heptose:LPS heptosyltransferase
VAINNEGLNWYDQMFERIGVKNVSSSFKRPFLQKERLITLEESPSVFQEKNNVLICHRASCQIRSSRFEDFYKPIKTIFPEYQIYVHEFDLTEEDEIFITKYCDDSLTVIAKGTMQESLLNQYDARFVVSTDTSAIHFREGIEKPCLGIFSAMTAESRVSGHEFTRGFNVETDCSNQPCFIHETAPGIKCKNYKGKETAYCQTGIKFQNQLTRELQISKSLYNL